MTALIANPGSRIGEPGGDWTKRKMHAEGLTGVALLDESEDHGDGRRGFMFRHEVTGVSVCLETHGIGNQASTQRRPGVTVEGRTLTVRVLADPAHKVATAGSDGNVLP